MRGPIGFTSCIDLLLIVELQRSYTSPKFLIIIPFTFFSRFVFSDDSYITSRFEIGVSQTYEVHMLHTITFFIRNACDKTYKRCKTYHFKKIGQHKKIILTHQHEHDKQSPWPRSQSPHRAYKNVAIHLS